MDMEVSVSPAELVGASENTWRTKYMCCDCHTKMKARFIGFGANSKPEFTFQKISCECSECQYGVEMSNPPRCPTCHHLIPISLGDEPYTWNTPDLWIVDGKPVRRDQAKTGVEPWTVRTGRWRDEPREVKTWLWYLHIAIIAARNLVGAWEVWRLHWIWGRGMEHLKFVNPVIAYMNFRSILFPSTPSTVCYCLLRRGN